MPLSPRSRADLYRQQPAQPIPRCTHCGSNEPRCGWQQRRDGGWHIRAECGGCGRFLKFVPQIEPFITLANGTASKTAVLDVLIECDVLGIDLHSDGRTVYVGNHEERRRMPRRLRDLIRQCSHDLAGLLGKG